MTSRTKQLACFIVLALALPAACSQSDGRTEVEGENTGVGGTGTGTGGVPNLGSGGNVVGTGGDPLTEAPPTVNCGDGILDADEACDDGNETAGDGCHSNCRLLDQGFVCPTPGDACQPIARCGDGIVIFPEQCDDGALVAGDGCSATCKVEIGFKCDASPSVCTATVCGDGAVEGAETCDDGNATPLDGCNERCQAEPNCTSDGCTSACGDGLVLGAEQCDDGNVLSGDGCSDTCQNEDGYVCEQAPPCDASDPTCILTIPAIFRDFDTATNADFGVNCGEYTQGVVQNELDGNGKPVLKSNANVCIGSADSFKAWYGGDGIVGTINLFPNENGGFVNRMTNDGQQYTRPVSSGIQWCSNSADGCDQCPAGYTTCYGPCTPWGENSTQTCAQYDVDELAFDGNPLFFPIPLPAGATGQVANIPEEVYGGGWKADPSGTQRNFLFSSEVTYWFKYEAGSTSELVFNGDDDVWVFLNRRLAVDLGGLHVPVEGTLTISDGGITIRTPKAKDDLKTLVAVEKTLADFGLEDGGVYEIKVFHAERKPTGSSFKLTLSGFNTARSECHSVCGDGVLGAGEECDDGVNDGGYNECQEGCVVGGYCGDGVLQEGEICDDNAPDAPEGCHGCRIIKIK